MALEQVSKPAPFGETIDLKSAASRLDECTNRPPLMDVHVSIQLATAPLMDPALDTHTALKERALHVELIQPVMALSTDWPCNTAIRRTEALQSFTHVLPAHFLSTW